MRNDAHQTILISERHEMFDRLVESLGVQAAESLVHENRFQVGAARVALDDVSKRERQRQRRLKALAAGQRPCRPMSVRPGVQYVDVQAARAPAIFTRWLAAQAVA